MSCDLWPIIVDRRTYRLQEEDANHFIDTVTVLLIGEDISYYPTVCI